MHCDHWDVLSPSIVQSVYSSKYCAPILYASDSPLKGDINLEENQTFIPSHIVQTHPY